MTIRETVLNNLRHKDETQNGYARRIGKQFGFHRKSVGNMYRKLVASGDIVFDHVTNSHVKAELKRLPQILIIDIETSPIRAFVWGLFKQNISIKQIISDRFVICWSAKWLYSKEVMSDVCTPKEAVNGNDKRIIESVYSLINSADIIIAHNGKKFDMPILNTRFLVHKMKPAHPFQIIDTCLIARKQFGHISNKLDFINGSIDLDQKIDTGGFELWVRCLDGDKESLSLMETYNKNDVLILEQNYLAVRPFIKSHPNLGLYTDGKVTVCPNCGSDKIVADGEYYYTMVGKYSTFRCENCGNVGHDRLTALTKDERNKLMTTCAR